MWRPSIIAVAMLGASILEWPSGFYIVLRVIVCAVALFGLRRFWKHPDGYWQLAYGAVVLLYNPISPVFLRSRASWLVVDAAVAIFLVCSSVAYQRWAAQAAQA